MLLLLLLFLLLLSLFGWLLSQYCCYLNTVAIAVGVVPNEVIRWYCCCCWAWLVVVVLLLLLWVLVVLLLLLWVLLPTRCPGGVAAAAPGVVAVACGGRDWGMLRLLRLSLLLLLSGCGYSCVAVAALVRAVARLPATAVLVTGSPG